jgi:large subunit ribosomal protein L17
MRHRVGGKQLNRDKDHRKALLKNLSVQLIENEKLNTTLVKAKFVKPYVEKLITKAKEYIATDDKLKRYNTVKYLRAKISSEEAVKKLVTDLATKFEKRPGGYTRLVKTGSRDGDNAPTARVEFIKERKAKNAKN